MGGRNDTNGAYPEFTRLDNTISISNDILSRTDTNSLMGIMDKLMSGMQKKTVKNASSWEYAVLKQTTAAQTVMTV